MAKQSEPTTLWLYLARRDKRGVRVLTLLTGRPQNPVRLTDLGLLQLPEAWQAEIERVIDEERMLWEPWIESAPTFDELRERLKTRGYTGLPLNGQPQFTRSDLLSPPQINVSNLPKPKKMVRRAKG